MEAEEGEQGRKRGMGNALAIVRAHLLVIVAILILDVAAPQVTWVQAAFENLPHGVVVSSALALPPQSLSLNVDATHKWQESLQNFALLRSRSHLTRGSMQKCEAHFLTRVLSSGRLMQLENGTRWEVDSFDRFDSALWLPSESILLCDLSSTFGEDKTMINLDRNSRNIVEVSPA
jgi:hypothetical protein